MLFITTYIDLKIRPCKQYQYKLHVFGTGSPLGSVALYQNSWAICLNQAKIQNDPAPTVQSWDYKSVGKYIRESVGKYILVLKISDSSAS